MKGCEAAPPKGEGPGARSRGNRRQLPEPRPVESRGPRSTPSDTLSPGKLVRDSEPGLSLGARRLRRPLCRAHTELQPRGGGKGVSTDTTGEAQGAPHPDTPAPGRQPRASPAHRPDRSARPASLGPHGAVRLAPACAVPQDKAVAEPVSRLSQGSGGAECIFTPSVESNGDHTGLEGCVGLQVG